MTVATLPPDVPDFLMHPSLERGLNAVQQFINTDRLAQVAVSTFLHGVLSSLVVRKGGDEHDRNTMPGLVEGPLHIETGRFGHLNVRNNATDVVEVVRVEKLTDG